MASAIPPELHNKKYINLATFRRNGLAVNTPVWFAEQDGKLYVMTRNDSGKIQTNSKQSCGPHCAQHDPRKGHGARISRARPDFALGRLGSSAAGDSRQVLVDAHIGALEQEQHISGNHRVAAHSLGVQPSQVECAVHRLRWLAGPVNIVSLLSSPDRARKCRHHFTEATWQ
jgi:hypothetical protein